MNVSNPSTQSYAILRIKRKRNEEPLDALVVESTVRRKKSRGGAGIFKFAQTVEGSVWDDIERQKNIQDEIARLSRETVAKEPDVSQFSDSVGPSSPISRKEERARHYTIIEHQDVEPANHRKPIAPPKILSAKDMELEASKSTQDFKMYDAVPAAQLRSTQDDTSEMEKFLPMLNDYLRLHESQQSSEKNSWAYEEPINDDDYVWDVFYHRPATLSEWNTAANVATLTGLPASFTDGYDSMSDSDEEFDEADEDSNAEEYYKNDYPDEEDSSDEFHEASEYEDSENDDFFNSTERF